MQRHKRLIRKRQHKAIAAESAAFPLPDGKPETRNIFGTVKRWNTSTGKYDIDL